MSVELAAVGVGKSVAKLVLGRVLSGRTARLDRSADLVDLIRVGYADELRRRKAVSQFEDIATAVADRLLKFCRAEYRGLTDGDREAVLAQVVLTLDRADLSDTALLADDADPVKLARRLRRTLPARDASFQLGEAGARLYDVVLDECCDCLARIVTHLPQFAPRASAETLSRLSGLAEQVETLLARMPARSLTAPEGVAEDEEFTRRYLSSLSETLDLLELFGVRFERMSRPRTSLSVAYISLNVSQEQERTRRRQEPVPRSEWREERTGGTVRIETALKDHRLLLVRAEAGGGKSTLLRWLAIAAARGSFSDELADWRGLVPFLVKLRSHAGGRLPTPEEFLDDTAGNLAGLMPKGWVHRVLLSGRALVLVDGVDEVTVPQRQAVREWVGRLVRDFPGIRVLVTSRPAAAAADWLRDEGFGTAFLEQLSPADLRELIGHWHAAVRDCAELPCEPERLPGYESRLLARFEAAPHLRMLASTPLLAAMLCALNLDRESLPRDRMGLYSAALDLLLETRDAKRGVPSAQTVALEKDQKIRILRDLAWSLSTSNRVELPKPMVERLIADRLAAMPNVGADASDVLDALLQRSGVLREPVPGRIDFVHRTVQEYLTAQHAADIGDIDLLVREAHRDQWRETVIMAAGHANEPLRRDLITGLLARIDAEPGHARRLKLLLVACLETLPAIPSDLRPAFDRCLTELVPPRDEVAARSLATAGEAVLDALPTSTMKLSAQVAQAAAQVAWLINGPRALDVLSRYAPDARHEVSSELAAAWSYFDASEFADRVLRHMPADSFLYVDDADQLRALLTIPPREQMYVYLDEGSGIDLLAHHRLVLTSLFLYGPTSAHIDPARLPAMPELDGLTLGTAVEAASLDFLRGMPKLRQLRIWNCSHVRDYSPLHSCASLWTLVLHNATHLATADQLPSLTDIRTLGLGNLSSREVLREALASAPALENLRLSALAWPDVPALVANHPLDYLGLDSCQQIEDFGPLGRLQSLRQLSLSETQVGGLDWVRGLDHLDGIFLNQCPRLGDLSPLASLPSLRELYLFHNTERTLDLTPFAACSGLTVYVTRGQRVIGESALGPRLKKLDAPLRGLGPAGLWG
ncbi:NACHT domain-containing protein [Actinomadura logoneensis]|uniref:NACHT domain-containing protein n=1 Tax=Actinomadura logoneensis TaxID=2293572 RepID=A0A372J8W8_9ACTN|nr:NACHT domain-containing protein [Actinomadura logoneensis]RFU36430.1 NACHT domain-containing protein [Actinomadura logoneensis]